MKAFIVIALCVAAAVVCPPPARTRDQLRAESQRLRELAAAEIRRLEAAGTAGLATEIRHLETEILAVERQIEHLDPVLDASRLVTLEHTLVALETRLQADIKKLHGGVFFAPPRTREQLRAESQRLRELAAAEIRRLEAAGTAGLATEIRHLETEILAVERQIEHLDPVLDASRLVTLEHTLVALETRLQADIKKLHGGVFFAPPRTRDQLRAESARLRELAAAEIRRLEAAGTAGLATEIRHLETEILAVERQIEHLDPVLDASRLVTLEHTLVALETRLQADIKKLHV